MFGVYKMLGISWVAEKVSAAQEGLYSMELFWLRECDRAYKTLLPQIEPKPLITTYVEGCTCQKIFEFERSGCRSILNNLLELNLSYQFGRFSFQSERNN
jgi:hypothetical protein